MNDEALKKIAKIVYDTANPHMDGAWYTAECIVSALPSIVSEMIPDLEWMWNGASYEAVSPLGEYRVAKTQNKSNDKYMVTLVTTYQASSVKIGYIDGEGSAKEFANEHHKSQLLSALGLSS